MRVLVTGAAGFLGQAVVDRLLRDAHDVVALVRPLSNSSCFPRSTRLTLVRGDLRQKAEWSEQLKTVDAVIHLAAATSGDLPEQFAHTVVATENLLTVLPSDRITRFVLVSSFSVYDFTRLPSGSELNEAAPIEQHPEERDAYTWAKLVQEDIVRDHCERARVPLTIIRPGAIYGPGKTWSFGSAISFGRFELVFSPLATFRLTHVRNCADAIVEALNSNSVSGTTVNLVDDALPTHAAYRRLCRKAGAAVPPALYVPWFLVASVGWMLRFVNRKLLGNRARLPEFLAYRRQQARWKPLRYSNALARRQLGWAPLVAIEDGVRDMVRSLSVPENKHALRCSEHQHRQPPQQTKENDALANGGVG